MHLMMWYSGANCSLNSQINTDVPTVHKFGLRTYTEKAISQSRYVSISLYYYRSCGQCYGMLEMLIFEYSSDYTKANREESSSWKSDLFVQFRVFYNKEFTR